MKVRLKLSSDEKKGTGVVVVRIEEV